MAAGKPMVRRWLGVVNTRGTFLRFGLTGMVFTVLGPSLFWLAYPLGAFQALILTEVMVHGLRFATFRSVVFKADRGYRVSFPRYLISALPVSLMGWMTVALFRSRLDRTTLTIVMAAIALLVGFCWSRYVYGKASIRNWNGASIAD